MGWINPFAEEANWEGGKKRKKIIEWEQQLEEAGSGHDSIN